MGILMLIVVLIVIIHFIKYNHKWNKHRIYMKCEMTKLKIKYDYIAKVIKSCDSKIKEDISIKWATRLILKLRNSYKRFYGRYDDYVDYCDELLKLVKTLRKYE